MKSAMFMFITGLLLTFGAVGGIENDGPLLDGLLIALVGLAIMGCGAIKLNRDALVDNPALK
jgi:hypothetical protein